MARIQKRVTKSGATTYVVKWRTPDGKDRSKGGFTTRKAANAYGTKVENAALHGLVFDPNAGKVLFRDAAAIWLDSRKADTRNNAENHRYALAPAATRRGDGKTLGIDAVFGGYPLNKITREYIQAWVNRLTEAGKKPSTVRHAFWTVRMVLDQAVADGRLAKNPAEHVKLPKERGAKGAKVGVVDRTQFLTAAQVSALVDATPWPYNVLVNLAAWSGLRAAELGGLQIQDIEVSPSGGMKLHVERTAAAHGLTKTDGSMRTVPVPGPTASLVRDYLAEHPRRHEPGAPLFPGTRLTTPRPTGVRATPAAPGAAATAVKEAAPSATAKDRARRQADALAKLTVEDAEKRLVLDWTMPLRHATFYKAVFRPAVLRANRTASKALLPAGLRFHSLRHTYASLCAAVPTISVRQVAEWMGHANPTTTELVYTHLYAKANHDDEMAALGALAAPKPTYSGNVVPLHG
ncbi:tyrosine-type recombinase/integrase [Mycobacterium persicum]|uniref:tyrosine-type recombinase/integrase n=1 Tax=Mycobacterium persicum TaxID=1487726 RepID=UPI0009F56F6E|nr:site-specific integrase [Mycobacterium persicum]ORB53678.1 site-specific integrase [Mycobacterium persicum]